MGTDQLIYNSNGGVVTDLKNRKVITINFDTQGVLLERYEDMDEDTIALVAKFFCSLTKNNLKETIAFLKFEIDDFCS